MDNAFGSTDTASANRFVNRTRELARLWSNLDEALEGSLRIVELSGEPGIGKSRLLDEFASRARRMQIEVAISVCDQDSQIGFQPWRQIFRIWMSGRDHDEIREILDIDLPMISQLVPELLDLSDIQAEHRYSDPLQERLRLFAAMIGWLRRAAERSPLVIILDDLQLADQSSLEFLEYLATEIRSASLLVVLAYRDIDIDRGHPMVQTLARLARSTSISRLRLRGLRVGDTARLIEGLTGAEPGTEIAAAVWDQTAGNPLFIGELLKLVSSTGQPDDLLERRKLTSPSTVALRNTVVQRLGRLSPACVQMMTRSSVLGRTFRLRLAEELCDLSEDQLLNAVDEGLQAGLLLEIENDDDLSFLHGIVHEVLYAELTIEERASLHRLAGTVIATQTGDRDEHVLPQLARHFYLGADDQTWRLAVTYCERAGKQARLQLSYHEAAELFARAIDVLTRFRGDAVEWHCELLLNLGEARHLAADSRGAAAAFKQAAELARQSDNAEEFGRAAIGYAAAAMYLGISDLGQINLLEEAVTRLKRCVHLTRVQVLSQLTTELAATDGNIPNRAQRAEAAWQEAQQVAARLSDPISDLLVVVARQRRLVLEGASTVHQRIVNSSAIIELADQVSDLQHVRYGYACRITALLEAGDISAAVEANKAYAQLSIEHRLPYGIWAARVRDAMFVMIRGNLEEAEQLVGQAFAELGESIAGVASATRFVQFCFIRREQARATDMLPMVESLASEVASEATRDVYRMLILLDSGRPVEAREIFVQLADDDFGAIPDNLLQINNWAILAEVCVSLGDQQRAKTLYSMLKPYDGLNISGGGNVVSFGAAAYYLGRLAALLDDIELASRHFEDALILNRKMGATLFVTQTEVAYGALLLKSGRSDGRSRGMRMLMNALATCQALGLTRLVEEINTTLASPRDA